MCNTFILFHSSHYNERPLPRKSNSKKKLKENYLSNPASKMPTTTESGGQGPNTAHDLKVEKGLPKIYQKESKFKSDQLKHTKISQLVKAKRTSL